MTSIRVVVAACICVLIAWSLAGATPLHPTKSSNDNKKGARWPSGSVINVYIEPDTTKPDGVDRSQLIKEGIERWKYDMAARGVTIDVTVGTAPAGTTNVVNATWEPNGTQVGNLEILRLSGGDFGASLMDCLEPGTLNNFAFDLLPLGEGEGRYYLVRGQG